MRKAYKYRLYPNKKQTQTLQTMLETHRRLHNRALSERKDTWEQEKRSVSYQEQSAHLKADRVSNAYLQATNFSSCQATLRQMPRAFEHFFCRLKEGEKDPGNPRFKGNNRFDAVEFPS